MVSDSKQTNKLYKQVYHDHDYVVILILKVYFHPEMHQNIEYTGKDTEKSSSAMIYASGNVLLCLLLCLYHR